MSTTQQSQLVQLDIKFKAPLTTEMQVNNINDLTSLTYNYEHKLVWVKSLENYFYLKTGFDGSVLNHWKAFSQKLTLEQYNPQKSYIQGDIVYINNKIYQAKTDISLNNFPFNNLDLWEIISGDIKTVRLLFNNQNGLLFYTDIVNPFFQIMIGEIEYQNNIPVMDSDGMIKINNAEIIDALILRRDDLTNNNGKAYEVKFFENNEPKNLTGVINIK